MFVNSAGKKLSSVCLSPPFRRRLAFPPRTICCEVLCQIGDGVALGLESGGAKGETGGRHRIEGGSVVHKVGVKPAFLDLLNGHPLGQLVDNGADHLHMGQFFRAHVGEGSFDFPKGHGVPLGQVPVCGAQFPVGPAELSDNHLGQGGVGPGNFYRVLQFLTVTPHGYSSFSQGQGLSTHSQRPEAISPSAVKGP